jgi:hypothetical protein
LQNYDDVGTACGAGRSSFEFAAHIGI